MVLEEGRATEGVIEVSADKQWITESWKQIDFNAEIKYLHSARKTGGNAIAAARLRGRRVRESDREWQRERVRGKGNRERARQRQTNTKTHSQIEVIFVWCCSHEKLVSALKWQCTQTHKHTHTEAHTQTHKGPHTGRIASAMVGERKIVLNWSRR